MSRELFKMNMIASVQKLDNEDIEIIQNYIKTIEQENKQLKKLCDKYEEEHSTEFKIWKDERYKLLDYKARIDKAIEYIKSLQESEVIKLNREENAFNGLTKKQVAKNELVYSMIKSDKLLEILGEKE